LNEARNLKSYGEFPETVKINETVTFGEEAQNDDIEFDVGKDLHLNEARKLKSYGEFSETVKTNETIRLEKKLKMNV